MEFHVVSHGSFELIRNKKEGETKTVYALPVDIRALILQRHEPIIEDVLDAVPENSNLGRCGPHDGVHIRYTVGEGVDDNYEEDEESCCPDGGHH